MSGVDIGSQGQLQPDIVSAGDGYGSQTLDVSGVIAFSQSMVTASANSGTTDTLTGITGADAGDEIYIRAASGHTLQMNTGSAPFARVATGTTITDDAPLHMIYDGTNWDVVVGAASGGGGGGSSSIDHTAMTIPTTTIATATLTQITTAFTTSGDDPNGNWDTVNDWYVAPSDGIYLIDWGLVWENNTTGSRVLRIVRRNSGGIQQKLWDFANLASSINNNNPIGLPSTSSWHWGSIHFDADATDYFQFYVYQNSGGDLDVRRYGFVNFDTSYIRISHLGSRA